MVWQAIVPLELDTARVLADSSGETIMSILSDEADKNQEIRDSLSLYVLVSLNGDLQQEHEYAVASTARGNQNICWLVERSD